MMRKVEKYSDDWILRLASSVGEININPLKKDRVSCGEFNFTLTDEGKTFMKGYK
jgi:hypothetical protein